MPITPRQFQVKACQSVMREFESRRSVCLVAPTGAGKTVMGSAIVRAHYRRGLRTLFLAHRRELIQQSAAKLREACGAGIVGVIMPGSPRTLSCPVQVASIQTLTSESGQLVRPAADLIVADECHHFLSDIWNTLVNEDSFYSSAKMLGLTATPQRRDGRPLEGLFDTLVVAAQHSELLHDGYLVPCRVYQPQRGLASNEVAVDPLKAYQELGNNTLCFGFASRIEQCEQLAQRFSEAGISSAVIEASTPKQDRSKRLADFRAGKIRVLWNVYALTEGVDVPEAGSVIIARKMDHCGMYLQCCGRVLRPAQGKTQAIIIDLSGATLLHGFPTEDREYALEGDAIKRTTPEQLRTCPACGACSPAWRAACPECGFVPPQVEAPQLVIYDEQLREVFQGANTPADAQRREYLRLRELGRSKGWNLYFVRKEYEKLFGRKPFIDDASTEEKTAEWMKLRALGHERGYKDAWAKVRFRDTFGEWPANSLIYSRDAAE